MDSHLDITERASVFFAGVRVGVAPRLANENTVTQLMRIVLRFIREIHSILDSKRPVIVHRTGGNDYTICSQSRLTFDLSVRQVV